MDILEQANKILDSKGRRTIEISYQHIVTCPMEIGVEYSWQNPYNYPIRIVGVGVDEKGFYIEYVGR